MANISVTYTFSNGSTADATEVNTNFQDIIDGTSDGTKDLSVSAGTFAGTLTANGNVNLGNATSDDLTITARVASDIDPKTASANDLGDSTQLWRAVYSDNVLASINAVGDPSYSFHADTNTGMYSTGADTLDFATGGTRALYIDSSQVVRPVTAIDVDGATIRTFATQDVSVDASGADIDWSSNNYTITDTDTYVNFYCTTGATNRTITLPTAADNTGRIVSIKKVDSGAGLLTLTEEGTDAIDGFSSVVAPLQYDFIAVQCDGTTWHIINRRESTPWTSFTTTLGNITIGNGSQSFFYRRVGDSVEINGVVSFGSTTSVSGTITFSLPSGITMDTSKITGSNSYQGVALANDSSPDGGYNGGVLRSSTSTTAFRMYGSNGATLWNATVPFTWATSDTLRIISVKVAISEWGDTA